MTELMTPKERWLAAIHRKPVDRLPFWPKLDGAYPQAQAEPFRQMALNALHRWIGSDQHQGIAGCLREVHTHTATETTRDNNTERTVFRTPGGTLELVQKYDRPSHSWHPVAFPVTTLDDILMLTEVFRDTTVVLDAAGLEAARTEADRIGSEALTTHEIGTSPLMQWVELLAGVENAHLLLADYRDAVEALFDAMHGVLLQKIRLLCEHSPADVFYLMENTSTTLISPGQFRRYCAPRLTEYAGLVRAAGRPLILHMCGHLKALLPDLGRIPAHAFEAFTAPTLGNTRLLDGRSACPDTCLIGGTHAMLWTRPPGEIIRGIEEALDALPHHRGIVVTSAGVMPPLCRPETIQKVCDWVKQYPARMG